jgi:hypothetical protein
MSSKAIVLCAMLGLGLFAIAGPAFPQSGTETHASKSPCDAVMLLDNSRSMTTNDPQYRIKEIVSRFVERLPQGSRAEVVVFGDDVQVALPLTDGGGQGLKQSITESLKKVTYGSAYTNIPAALELGFSDLKNDRREDAARFIVLLTDGKVDTGKPTEDSQRTQWMLGSLSKQIKDQGIRIFSIALGENSDFMLLQTLSASTDGDYFRVYNEEGTQAAFDGIMRGILPREVAIAPPPLPKTKEEPAQETNPPIVPASEQPKQAEKSTPPAKPIVEEVKPGEGPTPPVEPTVEAVKPAEEPKPAVGSQEEKGIREEEPAPQVEPTGPVSREQAEQESPPSLLAKVKQAISTPALRATLIGAGLIVLLLLVVLLLRGHSKSASQGALTDEKNEIRDEQAALLDINNLTDKSSHFLLKKVTTIGRSPDQDIVILEENDPHTVTGRHHAAIEYENRMFYLVDRGSRNGVFVKNERIAPMVRVPLKEGTEFYLGDPQEGVVLRFKWGKQSMVQTTGDYSANVPRQGEPETKPFTQN